MEGLLLIFALGLIPTDPLISIESMCDGHRFRFLDVRGAFVVVVLPNTSV